MDSDIEEFKYEDSDDELDDTPENNKWKINKSYMNKVIYNKDIVQDLVNYANNLVLFYETKIDAIKKLMKSKQSDNKKNFISDLTIQDEQKTNIGNMILNDSVAKNVPIDDLNKMIEGYYSEIGNKKDEVMKQDYDDRNKTIKYILLIKEYEENIKQIQNSLPGVVSRKYDKVNEEKNKEDHGFSGGRGANDDVRFTIEVTNNYSNVTNTFIYLEKNSITNPYFIFLFLNLILTIQRCLNNPSTISHNDLLLINELENYINMMKYNSSNVLTGGAKVTLSNGSEYEGELNSNGIPNGNGIVKHKNGNIYEGQLINGKANGKGILTNPNGSKYEGEWVDDKPNGKGILTYPNGSKYEGEWVDDKPNGSGTMVKVLNGKKSEFTGTFQDGNKVKGKTTYEDGSSFEGEYQNGIQYKGVFTNKNGEIYAQHKGDGILYDKNGSPFTGDFSDGYGTTQQWVNGVIPGNQNPQTQPVVSNNPPPSANNQQVNNLFLQAQNQTQNVNNAIAPQISELCGTIKNTVNDIAAINAQKDSLREDIKEKLDTLKASGETLVNSSSNCVNNLNNYIDEINNNLNNASDLLENINNNLQKTGTEMSDLKNGVTNIDKELADEEKNRNAMLQKDDEFLENMFTDLDILGEGIMITPKDSFIETNIKKNYVKNNLYEFVQICKKLDSVPRWRMMISTLIVSYLRAYVKDPNSDKNINVIPSYDYFNLVLMGTPGVGKSYTADIVGEALKWSGFLTIGTRKDIKKPDIVGSYTGQTAPKVYSELTQCLGKVVFIDEAYSIAGAKDQVKGTFNEFGQEALDAITDFTSEHIGYLGFIVAGYEYEMKTQFLDVNVGLPRRFPTVLTLQRYNMKSFWKILEGYIVKFCPINQVKHHHKACFELLNVVFNFQCRPNPEIKMSKNWLELWDGSTLMNVETNIKVNMCSKNREQNIMSVPIFKLADFNTKIANIESAPIIGETVEALPYTKFFDKINQVTATFIKACCIYKFTGIRNGDFFRSQADNLTKFSQTILSNKILNPSGKYIPTEDKKKNGGNIDWIQYVYFELYFSENPNQKVKNIDYIFKDVTAGGNYRKKNYSVKHKRNKKYTKKNRGKGKNKNAKTLNRHKYKKQKYTRKNSANKIGGGPEEDYKTLLDSLEKIDSVYNKKDSWSNEEAKNIPKTLKSTTLEQLKQLSPENINSLREKINSIISENQQKTDQEVRKFQEDKIALLENLNTKIENALSPGEEREYENDYEESMAKLPEFERNLAARDIQTAFRGKQARKQVAELKKAKENEIKEAATKIQSVARGKKAKQELAELKDAKETERKTKKQDLIFDIVSIDFSNFRDTIRFVDNIIRVQLEDVNEADKPLKTAELKELFKDYQADYNMYLEKFDMCEEVNNDSFQTFIYTYILLMCYVEAYNQSIKKEGPFNIDSWWFFSHTDFKDIINNLNIETIMKKYNELRKIVEVAPPSPSPSSNVTFEAEEKVASTVTPSEEI